MKSTQIKKKKNLRPYHRVDDIKSDTRHKFKSLPSQPLRLKQPQKSEKVFFFQVYICS